MSSLRIVRDVRTRGSPGLMSIDDPARPPAAIDAAQRGCSASSIGSKVWSSGSGRCWNGWSSHCSRAATSLIEGVPGLAKTRAVRALARALDLPFRRIQFTPDLLPADLTGTQIYRPATGTFDVRPGPIVTSVLLADEINRAPAKVQSALLEAMQEGQITVGDETIILPRDILGPGHPEPDRARRDLSASRGPARPVPDEAGRRLSRP